jgi:hypothetical protein
MAPRHSSRRSRRGLGRPEINDPAVASGLHDAPVVHGNRRVDEIAPEGSKPGQNAVLVPAFKLRVADMSATGIAASFRVSLIAPSGWLAPD